MVLKDGVKNMKLILKIIDSLLCLPFHHQTKWDTGKVSNFRPWDLESPALPTELPMYD